MPSCQRYVSRNIQSLFSHNLVVSLSSRSLFVQGKVMQLNNALALFEAVAACEHLTSFDLSIAECIPSSVDEEQISGLFSDNFSLIDFWFYQRKTQQAVRLNNIVNRNKFLQKQQRFKSMKMAEI